MTETSREYFGVLRIGVTERLSQPVYDPYSLMVYDLRIKSGTSESAIFTVPPGARTAALMVPDMWDDDSELGILCAVSPDAGSLGWNLLLTGNGVPVLIPRADYNGYRDITNTGILSVLYAKMISLNPASMAAKNQTVDADLQVVFK